jgi:plasmid stability protein
MVDLMGTLQVRDVPDDISRVLKQRAATAGQSLSEYVLSLLRRETSRPTLDEWLDRVASREPIELAPDAATDAVRAERDESDAHWDLP